MNRKIILITAIILIISSTIAYAWVVPLIRGVATIATSQGARTVAARAALSAASASNLVKLKLLQGGAGKAYYKLGNALAVALGVSYLIMDYNNLANDAGQTAQDESTRIDRVSTDKEIYEIRTVQTGTLQYGMYLNEQINLGVSADGYTTVIGPTQQSTYPQGTDYVSVSHYKDGQYQVGWDQNCISGYAVNVTNNYTGEEEEQTLMQYSEPEIEQYVENNPEKWTNQDYVSTELSENIPDGAIDMGVTDETIVSSEPYYDPVTATNIDPLTNITMEPVEDPDYGTYTPPVLHDAGAIDTTLPTVDSESIPELLTDWMSNAPFATFFDDFEINASGAQSSFQIQTPFNSTATIDFGQYASLWALISAIIIGFAYLYAIWILFAGAA